MISDERFAELEAMEAEWVRRERQHSPDPTRWRWSPCPLPHFREMLATAVGIREVQELDHQPSFFEAGCGIGTKMMLAIEEHGLHVEGWEIEPEYVDLCRSNGLNVWQRDLSKEQPPWAEYDIIYLSRPFKDDQQEREWEQHVMDAMRPGAVLMQAFAGVKPYKWRWYYRAPWRVVSVKPSDTEPTQVYPGNRTHEP
jgi:SAM-dependent methyltransferase